MNAQGAINRPADFCDALTRAIRQRVGKNILDPPALSVGVVPLGFKRGELRLSFGNLAKYHFAERKDAQSVVTQDADVELPSLDILFSQRFLVHALVNELNALLESFIGLDERALGNANRTFFPERFDEQREFQSLRSFKDRKSTRLHCS